MNAICRLGIVPVRKLPEDASEMISQLLYGELCYTLSHTGNWVEVEGDFDGYMGFVDKLQLDEIDNAAEAKYISQLPVLEINGHFLPMGSEIRDEITSESAVSLLTAGSIARNGQKQDRQSILKKAMSLLNSPYLWGGKSMMGVDCSGLTQTVFKACGYSLPRDSGPQSASGKPVSLEEAQTADLAFFSKPGKTKVSHVGIVSRVEGELQIVHASGKVRIDVLSERGIITEAGVLTHELTGLRDIITE